MDQLRVVLVDGSQEPVLLQALSRVAGKADLITYYGIYGRGFQSSTTKKPLEVIKEADVLVFTVRLFPHNRDRKPFDYDGQYREGPRYWKKADGSEPLIVVMYLCLGFDEKLGDKIMHRTPAPVKHKLQELSDVDYYWFNIEKGCPMLKHNQLGDKEIDIDAFIRRLTAAIRAGGRLK